MPTVPGLLVTVLDLAARVGSGEHLPTADVKRAEAAIADASALARDEARQSWVSPEDTPEAVRTVVLASARRSFTNPENYRSETAGPFTVQRDSDSVSAYFTEKELAILRRFRPNATGPAGLWTLPTTRGEGCRTYFAEDQFGSELIPYYTPPDGY